MEKIKLKKSLFIGLGGTGIEAILQAKKIFKETYPDVDRMPMIGFLGLDTDKKALETAHVKSAYGEIKLENNERIPITVKNANSIYRKQKDLFNWVHKNNERYIDSIEDGAGQFRSNGRFAFSENVGNIKSAVNDILSQINNASVRDNDNFEVISDTVDCHIIFSVCGGTGCGTFINMAYLLREKAPNCKISGYAVLPDIFKKQLAESDAKRVTPNAYGAIQDLDFLMSFTAGSDPINIKYHDWTFSTNDIEHPTPFDSFVFINNENTQNDIYSSVAELTQMLGLFLVTTTGPVNGNDSAMDNVRHDIASGNMEIEHKNAWVSGIGACEISFKSKELKELNALNVVECLIKNLQNSSNLNITDEVKAWVNKEGINEHSEDNADQVIDYFCDPHPARNKDFESIDENNPQNDLDAFIKQNTPSDFEKNCKEKFSQVLPSLKEFVIKHVNKDNGIGDTLHLLTDLETDLNISLEEMKSEIDEHTTKKETLKQQINGQFDNLKKIKKANLSFLHKSEKKDCLQNIADKITRIAFENREIMRRNAAINLFSQLISAVKDEETNINNINIRLNNIYSTCRNRINLQNNVLAESTEIFRINLSTDAIDKTTVDKVDVSELVTFLKYDNKIYDLYNADKDADAILKELKEFAFTLPSVKRWDEDGEYGTIDKIIDSLPDEQFENLTNRAVLKASPLLKFDARGYSHSSIHDSFYACVPDLGKSRFEKDDFLSKHVRTEEGCEKSHVEFESIGSKDRIIIYRIFSVIPPFTIAPVNTYKSQYDKDKEDVFFHFGTDLYDRMVEEGYELFPKAEEDEALTYWVKGLIFGLVSYKNRSYYYRNEYDNSIAVDDFYKKLSSDRVESFNMFKSDLKLLKKYFDDRFKEKIDNFDYNQEIEEAKSNYKLKYSLINLQLKNLDTLDTPSYKPTKEQLGQEIICAKTLKKE